MYIFYASYVCYVPDPLLITHGSLGVLLQIPLTPQDQVPQACSVKKFMKSFRSLLKFDTERRKYTVHSYKHSTPYAELLHKSQRYKTYQQYLKKSHAYCRMN
jgi:hypothetical protein